MGLVRRFALFLAALTMLASGPACAAAKDAVFNKEHVWAIDVDGGACAASRTLEDGAIFLFRARAGKITFGFFPNKPLKKGKAGRFETEAYNFDFAPSFGDDATSLYFNGDFNASAVAAVRLAREVRVLVDGRLVAAMTFEGTGFEAALDGLIACSNGASGWWGTGVGAPAGDPAPRTADRAADGWVFNKEGDWAISVDDHPGICIAEAKVDDHMIIQFLAALGRTGVAVSSDNDLPRGRKGKVQTDAFVFDFTPGYGGKRYLSSNEPLDSGALFALRRAKWLRISIDDRQLLDIDVTDTGFADMLTSVAACSKGEKGWWGDGAKPRS